MKKLFFVNGTNCSGKSSLAKHFLNSEPEKIVIEFPEYKTAATVCPSSNMIIIGNYSKNGTSGGCDTIRKKAYTNDMLRKLWDRPEDIFMEGYIIGSRVWIDDIITIKKECGERDLRFVTLNTELETCFARIEKRSGKTREQLKGNGANVISGHKGTVRISEWVSANRPEFNQIILDSEHIQSAELCHQLTNAL